MQVSATAGSSTAWAVRELFPPPQMQQAPTTARASGGGVGGSVQGFGGAQMSAATMQSLMGLQGGAPSAKDAAGHMIGALDSDGDGVLKLEEASAGGSADAAEAFGALDTDGDGALTADELASTLEEMGPPPGLGGAGGFGAGGSGAITSGDIAMELLKALDTDGEEGLSFAEVSKASGEDEEAESAFNALDEDEDDTLSLAELTSALDRYKEAALSRFSEQGASVTF